MKINVKKIALDYIKCEKYDFELYKSVRETLEPFEGKTLTQREFKKIKAALEAKGYEKVSVGSKYSWFDIELLDAKHPSQYRRENTLTMQLFYASEGMTFTLEKFDRRNTWATVGTPERIAKTEEALSSGRVDKIQKAYNHMMKAQELLEEVGSSYHNPFIYECQRLSGIKLEEVGN